MVQVPRIEAAKNLGCKVEGEGEERVVVFRVVVVVFWVVEVVFGVVAVSERFVNFFGKGSLKAMVPNTFVRFWRKGILRIKGGGFFLWEEDIASVVKLVEVNGVVGVVDVVGVVGVKDGGVMVEELCKH